MSGAFIAISLFNVTVFLAYAWDKRQAVKSSGRISETTLLMLAGLGPVGALYGVYFLRHKTRKNKFLYFLYVISFFSVCLQTALIFMF